ncbi:MAG: hypothetical protein HC898_06775 [Phycisphaerales bacterium]|nr:hypothetical protein [Phycisphaerales bacterium]
MLTIADNAMLDLTGGTLTVNQMQKVGTGSFNFTAGTLNLRQQDAVVDSVNPSFFLGDNFALGAGTRLNVTNYGFGLVVGQDGNGEMSFNGPSVLEQRRSAFLRNHLRRQECWQHGCHQCR